MFPGGIADKLGNQYEAKWLVRQLLDVIAGKAEWLRFEGITPQFDGFECAVSRGGVTEWHQTKINTPNGNWTVNALKREYVLGAFKSRLQANFDDCCLFVSQDPAKDLRTLVVKAGIANDLTEFVQKLSKDQRDKFNQLINAWEVDDATAYIWLRRCEFQTLPEGELDAIITSLSDLYFSSSGSSAFSILRDYAENRFNKRLTTELVRAELRDAGTLVLKDWSLDPTVRERLHAETDAYLQTYSPFGIGGSTVPRRQICDLVDQVGKPDGPNVVLLTGIAGSGKSGVIRGLIDKLRERHITHLAFRVDHHLHRGTHQEIGQALTGREESPVSTLKGLEPEQLSVLIIDQVDAVSEVAGRSGTVKETVLRMINDARNFKTVRVVLVCRSFDFDSDPRLKALREANSVEQIEVPLLAWGDEVAPFLAGKGVNTNLLSPRQKELLRLPLHLSVFLEIVSEGQTFASRNDLLNNLIQRKERAIRKGRSITWAIVEPLTALAIWMSDRQRLDALPGVLDRFPGARELLASEGLIVEFRNRINFFHESFFDYLYARAFVARDQAHDQSLVALLTSTEQHLFRRTQTRQILETLRQDDPSRYFRELEAVLTADAVRYHIKAAVAQWLGSLSDPTERERDIVLRLDDEHEAFRPLIRYALLSSTGWFDRLHEKGWVHTILHGESNERRQVVLWWLSKIAGERPTEVVNLLDVWWGHDPERGKHLLDWFGSVRRRNPDQALGALCEKVIRSRPSGLFDDGGQHRRGMVLATWVEKDANEASGILRALFDTWFDAHPGRHPFERSELHDFDMYFLGQVAVKSPRVFIAGAIDALSRLIDEINRREVAGERDYSFRHRSFAGHRFGADKFLGFFRSALRQVASEAPEAAREFLSKLDASKHEALLHLHLEAMSANGEALASHLLDLLGNEHLFEAGWDGAAWKSFADAARATFPHLSSDDRRCVEKVMFSSSGDFSCDQGCS